jgi:hypothetical protein
MEFISAVLELILGGIARHSRITARTAVKDRRATERRRVAPHSSLTASTPC